MSSSFSLLANHTWSKCLNIEDAQGDLASTTIENPNNPAMDYAPCGADYRNVENVVLITRSNFKLGNRYAAAVVNGWELAPLAHILSGAPFTVTSGVDISRTAVANDRPSLIPGMNPYLGTPLRSGIGMSGAALASARNSLNPAAFCSSTCVAVGSYGTLGRNAFRGRPNYQFDAQISRLFPLYERVSAALRLEAFNVLNHPNFNNPTTAFNSEHFRADHRSIGTP